ncbi:VOC family protein [Streptomyces spongiae]|uniref:Glyoxalase n=1 Tax=Streptomyces spongiae TaxID=565072 RepID=A0A5N8XNQ1_9ACTN|nr:VOC family protein [Streptomyces spongiae]MPY61039.1 glyoxalase [Streptomyces spongiae]
MTRGLTTIIYPVKDLDRAKALFSELLGTEPYADSAYYVGFKDAGQDVGLDPHGHAKGMTGPVPYWHVSDIRSTLAALLGAGAETLQDVHDVGGGKLIASVKDVDGNLIGLMQNAPAE